MLFQVYIRAVNADIKGLPNTPKQEILKRAIQAVGTFPIEPSGEPMYVGANTWIVPFGDAPIGEPIEAETPDLAIAQVENAVGFMNHDLYAEEVYES